MNASSHALSSRSHDWLDSWAGLGLVVAGMTHQSWDVQLTAYGGQ